jgi:hypothetical protein
MHTSVREKRAALHKQQAAVTNTPNMHTSVREKRAALHKQQAATDSRFQSTTKTPSHTLKAFPKQSNDNAPSNNFKARPLPKQSNENTPAAMKARRALEEKERQIFRNKVEAFYHSKPELQSKWEKARDVLLVKYATGNKWKGFNRKLIEKYGDEFAQFDPSNAENHVTNGNDDDGRVACNYCDRKFGVARICEHEQICANLKNRRKVGRKGGQAAGGTYRKRTTVQEQTFEEPRVIEEEVDESVEIAQAAAELEQTLSGMSEMEALEYQLSKMKRLQRMKH